MRQTGLVIIFVVMQSLSGLVQAQSTNVNALRYWTQPEEARLVFDLNTAPVHNVYTLQNPPRLVIDFKSAKLMHKISQPNSNNAFFATIDTGVFNDDNLRVVIELKKNITFKDFTLKPNKALGNRLVVDVYTSSGVSTPNNVQASAESFKTSTFKLSKANAPKTSVNETNSGEPAKTIPTKNLSPSPSKAIEKESASSEKTVQKDNEDASARSIAYIPKNTKNTRREFIVAIDAGHGGEDPGAHGQGGTEEKRVVLSIARKLESMLTKHPGITPVMVRDGDYFIKLRKRIEIAREAKADLFVSIHADAFKDASVKGSSVFTLSSHGASSEAARWLADSENSADLIGGVSLGDKDDMLASVLLDLSQTATTEASSIVAKKVLTHFRQVNSLHKSAVQKAGFLVLKSPDIPSILVETAFISNPSEESKLRSSEHQEKMAAAIYKGIVAYFKQNVSHAIPIRVASSVPMASAIEKSAKRHAVARGETLSSIAQHYNVTMRELKSANALAVEFVKIGQKLRIPTES